MQITYAKPQSTPSLIFMPIANSILQTLCRDVILISVLFHPIYTSMGNSSMESSLKFATKVMKRRCLKPWCFTMFTLQGSQYGDYLRANAVNSSIFQIRLGSAWYLQYHDIWNYEVSRCPCARYFWLRFRSKWHAKLQNNYVTPYQE